MSFFRLSALLAWLAVLAPSVVVAQDDAGPRARAAVSVAIALACQRERPAQTPAVKTCDCSPACSCGCQDGQPCTCPRGSVQVLPPVEPYRLAPAVPAFVVPAVPTYQPAVSRASPARPATNC